MIKCTKCNGRMMVDRVFLSEHHLELYCFVCGKREMYPHPYSHGEKIAWIMNLEKQRAKKSGNPL
jgi:hypothetical protein